MVRINPSLMFTGACGDAFRRYASLFGGEIVMMLTYAESPLAETVPPDWRDKVWFARLRAGGLEITGGDPGFYSTGRALQQALEGTGRVRISTGDPERDRRLERVAGEAALDVELVAERSVGVEEVAAALGEALARALAAR